MHWIVQYCDCDRTVFYESLMEEHHWTPEVISTQFTVLQLIAIFKKHGDEAARVQMIAAANSKVMEALRLKRGSKWKRIANHE